MDWWHIKIAISKYRFILRRDHVTVVLVNVGMFFFIFDWTICFVIIEVLGQRDGRKLFFWRGKLVGSAGHEGRCGFGWFAGRVHIFDIEKMAGFFLKIGNKFRIRYYNWPLNAIYWFYCKNDMPPNKYLE
jgi:hypothetical protein